MTTISGDPTAAGCISSPLPLNLQLATDTGKTHWGWDASKPQYVGIIPRDGDAKDIRWFKGPNRGNIHTFNARIEGCKVILEAPVFDSNPFPFFPAVDGSAWNPQGGRAFIRRQIFDLDSRSDSFTEEIVLRELLANDLVRIDNRYCSLPYRYGYVSYADAGKPFDRRPSRIVRGSHVRACAALVVRRRPAATVALRATWSSRLRNHLRPGSWERVA